MWCRHLDPNLCCHRNWMPIFLQLCSIMRNNGFIVHNSDCGKSAKSHKMLATLLCCGTRKFVARKRSAVFAPNKTKNILTAFCALSTSGSSTTTCKLHMVRKLASASSVQYIQNSKLVRYVKSLRYSNPSLKFANFT